MEVVAAGADAGGGGGGAGPAPFARRDVREWSRLDSATGAREHARVESDRWSSRSAAGARSYGKVVDSRVCNAADGRAQATSRRQLEVFRQQGPGGSFQVVRTSSTSVSSSSSSSTAAAAASARLQLGFDNLQLSLNPLDVGPQRTRASVGRSGSIGSRRPPSRQPRANASAGATPSATDSPATSAAAAAADPDAQVDSLTAQVSRICRQLHVEAQRAAFGPSASRLLGSAAAAASDVDDAYDDDDSDAGVVIQEVSDSDSGHPAPQQQQQQQEEEEEEVERPPASAPSQHPPAARRRSSSTEDLQQQEEGSPRVDEHPAWTRASQVRRSLQFPARTSQERESSPTQRPLPGRLFPEDSKLFEGGKLKGLEALESVFRRGANIAESVNKSMTHDHEHSDASNADSLANHLRNESISRSSQSFNMDGFMRRNTTNTTNNSNASKRHSFVTVESLKEVRGRLRPLNSPSDEEPKQQKSILKPSKDEDDQDDGIVTDDHVKHPDSDVIADVPPSKVKSYILGMEVLANNNRNGTRKPVLGTGSLESRTSNRSSSSSNNRSEEWYNRRKSYGFEQVHAPDATENSRPTRLWEKNRVESSTDSGICRSSEAVAGPPWNRTSPSKIEEGKAFDSRKPDVMKISHSIQIKKQEEIDKISENGEMKDEDSPYQRGRRTIVTLGNEYNKSNSTYKSGGEDGIIVHNSIIKDTSSVSLNGYRTSSEDEHRFKPLAGPGSSRDVRRQSEPVTITIPIVSEDGERETSNVESKRLFFRQLSEGTSLSIESADRKSAFTNGTALKDSFKRGTWNGGDDWANVSKAMDNEMKRHSIAVDESKYVREGIKRFSNLHDTKTKELANVSTSELVKRFAAMHAGKKEEPVFSNKDKFSQNPIPSGINVSFVQNGESFSNDDQNKKHKKVEFCKTEVHFAAESGRVNIVETDEKPPPSNPIRRRRRSVAGSLPQTPPDASKSSLPEIRFGDSPYEKKLLGGNETESAEAAPMPVIVKPEPTRPTVLSLTKFQNDCEKEDQTFTQANATIAQSLHQESTISAYSETVSEHISVTTQPNEPMPRSILKNNRKPKPFILGESSDSPIETNDGQEEKWGVRLRPVQSSADPQGSSMWRSTVTLRSTAFDSVQPPPERKDEPLPASIHGNGESELQKMLKALRPAGQRRSNSETDSSASPQCSPIAVKKNIAEPANNSVQVTISSPPTDSVFSGWSVADRIKHVEEMKQSSPETKGYSTRINFGSGEATIIESGSSDDQQNASLKHSMGSSLFQKSDKCKPMWLRREEKKQELQGPEQGSDDASIHQVSVASAMLPSYDPNRIRRVETLVSTRSGQPKITSIALRYEGDRADDRPHKQSAFSTSTYTQQQQQQQHSAWKNLDAANSYPPRNEEQPSVGFTYYKPSDAGRSQALDERRDRTFKIDKHSERLHIEEKTTREKVSPNREQLFTSERRACSPNDSHLRATSPAQNRRPTSYPSAQKPSSPCPRYDSDRERSLSPASKRQPKAATYFGEVNSRSSAYSSAHAHRQESPRKAEGSRGSYERKGEERSRQRPSSDSAPSGHQRQAVESLTNGLQRSRVETSTREERRRSSYESSARSRSTSRGRSLSPSKARDGRKQPTAPPPQPAPALADGYDSPIYENIDEVLEESAGARRVETDSAILEELTRAADQILQAVNGYTDEDSRASSDDDDGGRRYRRGRRGGRPAERLCTIAEAGPAARRPGGRAGAGSSGAAPALAASSASTAATRRAQRLSQTRLGNNSSTSSIESFTREVRRSAAAVNAHAQARALLRRERLAVEETRRKVTSATASAPASGQGTGAGAGASKPSSRTARLLQRASSRELLLKAHASSSEDVMSGAEAADAAATAAAALAARKARGPRRQRATAASNGLSASAAAAAAAKSNSLTSASSGGRRPSPAAQVAAVATTAAAAPAASAAGRPRRREADVPRTKDRSHGTRSEDIRRRTEDARRRREEADAVRTRSSRPSGHGGGGGSGGGGAGRERGAGSERRPAVAAAAAGRAAAPGAASHAVAKKPSSSRSESLSHSKVSK